MNKFKVIFTAEKIYFADDLDKAQEIAESDLNRMANPLKAQVFSVSPHTAQHNWESVRIYPLRSRGGKNNARRLSKELHEWTYEVNWNHSLPIYGEKKMTNDKQFEQDFEFVSGQFICDDLPKDWNKEGEIDNEVLYMARTKCLVSIRRLEWRKNIWRNL